MNRSALPPPIPRRFGDDAAPVICRMVFDEICVLANGEIVCSCGDPAGLRVYGNVYRDSISDVFNGSSYREIRRWQLQSRPDSWCPVTRNRCGGRRSRASAVDHETECTVKVLQLEPISSCNLNCPECPVSHFFSNNDYRTNRQAVLPLELMLEVVDQLPDLEKILFYNFGESFLHKDAISFLREVRNKRPDVLIHTNTNGTVLDETQIRAVAGEGLVDQMLFSIDGPDQETYKIYRRRGDFSRVLHNLEYFTQAAVKSGRREKIEIIWQYILFDWNDSDAKIEKARILAQNIGVPIKWVVTHTAGASQRFKPGSPELVRLCSKTHEYDLLTCDLRMAELCRQSHGVEGFYSARITADRETISVPAQSRSLFPVRVENSSRRSWEGVKKGTVRLGIQLRTSGGREIRELQSVLLPFSVAKPDGEGMVMVDIEIPDEKGFYQLLIDVVEERVCWFHERSSQPLVLQLLVTDRQDRRLDWERIVNLACRVYHNSTPDNHLLREWAQKLDRGVPLQNFLLDLFRDKDIHPANWNALFMNLWYMIQPFVHAA